ncbi:MAG: ABC transporter permease [Candidatus Gracilibacteria bacterium]|jgi:putative ABC transport system permease protein
MKFEILYMAFEALISNKLRTFLSMLGVIIGVSTVIVVVGIGSGAQKKVDDQYKNLNVTTILAMGNRGKDSSSSSKISEEDVAYVLENASFVATGAAIVEGSLSVAYGSTSSSLPAIGTDPGYLDIANLELSAGRSFTEDELTGKAKVAIIGYSSLETFWGDETTDPESVLGEYLTVNNKKVEIIGVLEENGTSSSMLNYDDSIFVPFTTAEKTLLGSNARLMLNFLAKDAESVSVAMVEIEALLRKNHKLKDGKENDFRLMDAGSMVESASATATTMAILLTSVATIVLIVSGIGIMNVMFVTVSERTKEIGIIKAVGGEQKDILSQFLLEAVILSGIGGIIGVVIGETIIPFLNSLEDWYVVASVTGVAIAFSFSALVGIFFGFYPALQASRLDPVDALRGE